VKKLIVAPIVALAFAAPVALAGAHFVKVSPGVVKLGDKVRVYGSVDGGCEVGHKGDAAELYSKAFAGTGRLGVGDLPTVDAPLDKHGNFSIKVTINKHHVVPGKYTIGGRCGGGNFGSTSLRVKS
jgi:hypothetical protein